MLAGVISTYDVKVRPKYNHNVLRSISTTLKTWTLSNESLKIVLNSFRIETEAIFASIRFVVLRLIVWSIDCLIDI